MKDVLLKGAQKCDIIITRFLIQSDTWAVN